MSPAIIQQLWTLLLPLIVFIVSYIIQQERWPAQLNGLIALFMVVVATAASLLLQGGNITDASVVAAFSAALQSEALAPLMPYLRSFPEMPSSAPVTPQPPAPSTNTSQPPA